MIAALKQLLHGNRWYERVGGLPASDQPGLLAMLAASGASGRVTANYLPLGDDVGLLVTLGCADRQILERFCDEVDAVDLAVEWRPFRATSPQLRDTTGRAALTEATTRLHEAEEAAAAGRKPSRVTPVLVLERLGHAAASVDPPTAASQRARASLAETYERTTGGPAPFLPGKHHQA